MVRPEDAIENAEGEGDEEDDDGGDDDVGGHRADAALELVHRGALEAPVAVGVAGDAVRGEAGRAQAETVEELVGELAREAESVEARGAERRGAGGGEGEGEGEEEKEKEEAEGDRG